MNEPLTGNGAFLLTFESELKQDALSVKHSILVEALFARRVCLNDSNIIDNEELQEFVLNNERYLLDEVKDVGPDHPPMLGACSRKGADIFAVLDLMLTPNARTGLPTYFTRLGPMRNGLLRRDFSKLRSADERRRAFFKLAGDRANRSLEVISKYLQSRPRAVVDSRQPRNLFDTVKEKLVNLKTGEKSRRLKDIDRVICRNLLKEINLSRGSPSRERLHLAIYDGRLPHYLPGRGEFEDLGHDHVDDRLGWRYLINTYYNFNLSEKYGSRPTLNRRWFRIPRRLIPADDVSSSVLEKVREIKLEGKIYPELLTVPFVASVRRSPEFWGGIGRMQQAQYARNATAYADEFEKHLKFIVSCCEKRLRDSGYGHLLAENPASLLLRRGSQGAFVALLVEKSYRLWLGLPQESFTLDAWRWIALTVTGLFAFLGVKVKSPEFKSLGAELGTFARESKLPS